MSFRLAFPLFSPALLVLALTGLAAQPAPAAETTRYSASLLGVTVGRMTLSVATGDSSYAVASQTTSTGLAGLFSPFKVTNRVKGTVSGGTFRPTRYESQGDGERAGRGAVIEYEKGEPRIIAMDEERHPGAPVLDPATQAGKVDPLTLTYALLRDIPAGESCTMALDIFDGHRAARMTLGAPETGADSMTCRGLYRRVDGYPPEDLAERQDFPFVVRYARLPDGSHRPMEIVLDSLFGAARLTRDN